MIDAERKLCNPRTAGNIKDCLVEYSLYLVSRTP